MSCSIVLNLDNSITFKIVISNPEKTPVAVNDATVTATVVNASGSVIVAPFVLPYVVGSEGIYRETIQPVASLIEGDFYTIIIDSVGGDGVVGQWTNKTKAKTKK